MTTLVLGSSGQLAQHLRELLPQATFWGRADADMAHPAQLEDLIARVAPTAIVNAAAYTAVDRAESEPDMAWRVNAEATAVLARVAARLDVPFVHVSTDYVFNGQSKRAYTETDPVAPLSVYGATKLAGELATRAICKKHWILRTSWVFSEFGANFVKTMLRLAKERDSLRVVCDQRGRPTYAGDIARTIVGLLDKGEQAVPFGTHNLVGGRAVSWHEFATEIIELGAARGLIPRVIPVHGIPASEYPVAAQRPANSVLRPSPALAQVARINWSTGLKKVLAKLA